MKILIIEDDKQISDIVKSVFEMGDEKNEILQIEDGKKGYEKATSERFDLVILDLNLPGMDGINVCKNIRKDAIYGKTPIIMLTARLSIDSKIDGLEAGADDYISKPFDLRELKLRADNLLKKSQNLREVYEFKDLKIDFTAQKVHKTLDGEVITSDLSPRELDVMRYFIKNIGQIKSPEEIYEDIWEEKVSENPGFLPNLKFFIAELRQKTFKTFIKNKSKVGFYLNNEEFGLK
ncbi:response regulator transcription factor [Candidatus Gracilibacteria bacterium]|nr:response regulator transcription factor [Candidatus Gracilibacteria bacterium]